MQIWNNPIVSVALNLFRVIVIGKYINYFLLAVIILSVHTYYDYVRLENNITKFGIDMEAVHYWITSDDCIILVRESSSSVEVVKANNSKCFTEYNTDALTKFVSDSKKISSGANNNENKYLFIAMFIIVSSLVYASTSRELIVKDRGRVFTNIVVIWMAISTIMLPYTYLSNNSIAKMNHEDKSVYVDRVVETKDGRFVSMPEGIMGQLHRGSNSYPKKF